MLRSLALHVGMTLLVLVMVHGAAARKAPAQMTVTYTSAETGSTGLSSAPRAPTSAFHSPRGTPASILTLHGWHVRGFSRCENAHVRGANGHVQRKPGPKVLHGVTCRDLTTT